MKKLLVVLAVSAAIAPAAALAEDPPASNEPSPTELCRTERTGMGSEAFKQLYGTNKNKSNAFGKCVVKKAHAQQAAHQNAAKQCRAEQDDSNFAAAHEGKTFAQVYGTGNGKNAFGRCVSSKAKTAEEAEVQATVSAAKQCKSERSTDPAAFKQTYGTNKNKSNAFGKCVSQKAKAKLQQP